MKTLNPLQMRTDVEAEIEAIDVAVAELTQRRKALRRVLVSIDGAFGTLASKTREGPTLRASVIEVLRDGTARGYGEIKAALRDNPKAELHGAMGSCLSNMVKHGELIKSGKKGHYRYRLNKSKLRKA